MKKKRRTPKQVGSRLEASFLSRWRKDSNIPIVAQHKFHKTRMWRFDFAFPKIYLAIEIQGYGRGHISYSGMAKDHEKYNTATKEGWSIIFLMSKDLQPTTIRKTVRRIENLYLKRKEIQSKYQEIADHLQGR